VKKVFSVVMFFASIGGVIALTHWLPVSPLASIAGGSGGRDGKRVAASNDRGDRGDRGPRNRDGADLSVFGAAESLGTIVPQALIVGAFAFCVEGSRRRRNAERRDALFREPVQSSS
jgi:hypothetical protein